MRGGTEPRPESKSRLWNKLSLGGAKSRGLSVGGRTCSWSQFLLMCACVCEFVRVLWLQVGVSVCGWNEDVSEEKDTLEKEIKKKKEGIRTMP